MAQTLALKLDEIERIASMISQAEARRNAALREVDRHRKALAKQLQHAIETTEESDAADGLAEKAEEQ